MDSVIRWGLRLGISDGPFLGGAAFRTWNCLGRGAVLQNPGSGQRGCVRVRRNRGSVFTRFCCQLNQIKNDPWLCKAGTSEKKKQERGTFGPGATCGIPWHLRTLSLVRARVRKYLSTRSDLVSRPSESIQPSIHPSIHQSPRQRSAPPELAQTDQTLGQICWAPPLVTLIATQKGR